MTAGLEFKRWYQGEFPQVDTQAINLRCLYFYLCERYDRRVCRIHRNGVAIPTTPKEMALVNKYAWGVRGRLREIYGHLFDSGHNGLVSRWTFNEWKRGAMEISSDGGAYNYIAGNHIVPGVPRDALSWVSYDPVKVGNW